MDKKIAFDRDKIIDDLMLRVFHLEIHTTAHRNAVVLLLQQQLKLPFEEALNILQEAVNAEHEKQKSEHPWFEQYWKDKLGDLGF